LELRHSIQDSVLFTLIAVRHACDNQMKKLILEIFAYIKKIQNNFLPLLLGMIDVKIIALFWRKRQME